MAKAPNPTGRTRTAAQAAYAAEQAFTLYYALGPNRTLDKLREVAPKTIGIKIPRTTAHNWSMRYDWQRRVQQLDAETARSNTAEAVRRVQEMNEQQAVIGQMGVTVAARALERMSRQLNMAEPCEACGMAPLDLDANDTALMMNTFAKWQRMGLGEVTDRTEIATTIWNVVIEDIVQLFLAVNIQDDAEARKRDFMLNLDETVGRHVLAVRDGV